MDPLKIDEKRLESISSRLLEKGINLSLEDVHEVADLIKVEVSFVWFHEGKEILETIRPTKKGKR